MIDFDIALLESQAENVTSTFLDLKAFKVFCCICSATNPQVLLDFFR